MSFFLPLLVAGALVTPSVSPSTSIDDKNPRARRVVVDTVAHRKLAADLVIKARTAAESGSLIEARAQLLVANTMMRESGGVDSTTAYALVHIDYALDRYAEAGDVLNELSEEAQRKGNMSLAANAAVNAAELYNMAGNRHQLASSLSRARELLKDSRLSDAERTSLRKRVG